MSLDLPYSPRKYLVPVYRVESLQKAGDVRWYPFNGKHGSCRYVHQSEKFLVLFQLETCSLWQTNQEERLFTDVNSELALRTASCKNVTSIVAGAGAGACECVPPHHTGNTCGRGRC